jgi:hypothetical protein
VADGYRAQVAPERTTQSLPFANEDSFGASIGEAIFRGGGELGRQSVQKHRLELERDYTTENIDVSTAFEKLQADYSVLWDRAQKEAGSPDAPDTAALAKWKDERGQELLGNIKNNRLRTHYIGEFQSWRARADAQADILDATITARRNTNQAIDAGNFRANAVGRNAPAEDYVDAMKRAEGMWNNMPGVSEDVRHDGLAKERQNITISWLGGMPGEQALANLASGDFDGILTPGQMDQVRNGAEVEVRRKLAQGAHEDQLARAALRDEVETTNAQISAGVEVPDSQLADLQSRLTAIGDQGGATKMGIARVESRVRQVAKVWRPEEYDNRINDLAGQKKRTSEEDIELATLRRMRPGAVATFNANPGEWAANNGMPPPALDLGDPNSIAARKSWARTVAATAGRPVPLLTAAEAGDLRAQATESARGRLAVADQLAALGDYRSITSAARQVAPGDAMLARLSTLPRETRASAVAGAEVRKTQRDLVDGVAGQDALDAYRSRVGTAAQLMNPSDTNAAFETARNLYANWAARNGVQEFREDQFATFIHQSLGGVKGARGEKMGGVGQYNRQSVLLAPGLSQGSFDKVMARLAFRPGPKFPVWQDGRAMTPAEVKRYQPVLRPDGRYEFHGPGTEVLTVKGGSIWTLDIQKVAKDLGL